MNELRRINAKMTDAKGVDVPTLVPDSIMRQWLAGDDDPLYVVESIKYPMVVNGNIEYTGDFFRSFIEKTRERPIPGSKGGHSLSTMSRPPTDLLMVGGKVIDNGDGTGTAYLKNFIPATAESGDNSVLRKLARSNMLEFSLVAYVREERNGDTIRVLESITGERNDAVETGAMEQTLSLAAASEGAEREPFDGRTGIYDEETGQVVPAGMYDALESDREAKRNADDPDATDLKTGRPVTFGGGDVVDY